MKTQYGNIEKQLWILLFWTLPISLLLFISPVQGANHYASSISEANKVGEPGDTVYIAAGTYSETLRPAQSGTPDNYITYIPAGGPVIIENACTGVDLNSRSYIRIIGLKLMNMNGSWIKVRDNSHHNVIEGCYMETAFTWSGISMETASYIRFIDNTFKATCSCTSACYGANYGGPHDIFFISNSDHILIEGNELYDAIHSNIDIQDPYPAGNTSYNIIRNNYISNKWHSNIDIWSLEYILVENNWVVEAGEEYPQNYCSRSERDPTMERAKHKGIFMNTQYSICRFNTVVNNGFGLGIGSYASDPKYDWKENSIDNRFYHNTVVQNQRGLMHNSTDPSIDNILQNNIFHSHPKNEIFVNDGEGPPSTHTFIHNSINGGQSVYSSSDILVDNISNDPLFVDTENRDFHLTSDSKLIDGGAWLTTTTGTGSGTRVPVADARFFMDGWELIDGDLIQFEGQTETYRITKVNYDTNEITLDQSAAWSDGLGIAMPYQGNAPDIGALEYGGESLSITTTSLADGVIDQSYSVILAACGGKTPYTWVIAEGNLPDGLSLETNGVISGTPTTAKRYSFTVKVEDADGNTDTRQLTIIVNNTGTSANLANGSSHISDSRNFSLQVTADGLWDNNYTNAAHASAGNTGIDSFWVEYDLGRTYDITLIRFTGDAEGNWVSDQYSVLTKMDAADSYVAFIDHAYGLSNLPIETCPTSLSARYIRLEVFNNSGTDGVQAREFEIFGTPAKQEPVSITTQSLPDGRLNQNYAFTLTASGGTAPYNWTIIDGDLPNGLTLSTDGVVRGKPITTGRTSITVQVSDENSNKDNRQLSVTINEGDTRTESELNLANGDTHNADSQNFSPLVTLDGLWDGDYTNRANASVGNKNIGSFWVEYDLGKAYDISLIRFTGDAEGNWVSDQYSVLTKMDRMDNYVAFIDRADGMFNDPIETYAASLTARFIRLEVFGSSRTNDVQAREFEIFGTPAP